MAKNKTVLLLSLLGSCWSWGKEFPKLCPTEQNLPQICEQIKQIKPNQTLVFEDGFTMNTCALKTQSNEESRLRELEKNLSYEFDKLISNRYPTKKGRMAEALQNPEQGKLIYPSLSDEFDRLIGVRKSIGIYTEVTVAPFSMNDEVKFAADSVRALAINKVPNKSSSELNHILGIIDMARKSDVKINEPKFKCRPEVNAFYDFDSKKITMKGMAFFPPQSRIAIFGHEVGHSIETCHFTKYRENKPQIFADLESCVRNELGFASKIDPELNCDRHTAEAFCDHIGVHVLEEYLKKNALKLGEAIDTNFIKSQDRVIMPPGYQNIMVFLDMACSGEKDTHPSGKKRLLETFMRSPVVAESLKCPVDKSKPRCSASEGLVKGAPKNPTPQSKKSAESPTRR